MNRLILHCDLDCFFAAVEIRDNPQYRGKPVIIGADPKDGKGRGVVSTCSYEARKFGLHSGMPISQAFQRCPHGIYLRPSVKKYTEASKSVMNILRNYSENFQQMGNDEAYIELTDKCTSYEEANQTAKLIQKEISLAKIASDCNKPNGITLFKPNTYKEMLKNMDITRIPGIGKKSKVYFYKKGIKKIEDILKTPLHKMIKLFGEHGKWIWNVVNGFDNRKVKEFHGDRKSISAERTFYSDTDDFKDILSKLEDINKKIHKSLKKYNITYKTITLKIRFEGYQTYTRSKTLPYPIQDEPLVIKVVLELLQQFSNKKKKVRLVGIKLSNLEKSKKARQTNILNFAQT
ncbi:MAG: DNA polymerase IV [Promethearchaeota archaeon]|jgi:DNA polymerase IV (DinB-like DNA polymerase)